MLKIYQENNFKQCIGAESAAPNISRVSNRLLPKILQPKHLPINYQEFVLSAVDLKNGEP